MKVALFSDVITWVGTGQIPDADSAPEVIVEGKFTRRPQFYSNLALQGGSSVLDPTFPQYDPDVKAAYVMNDSISIESAVPVTDIVLFKTPVSTEGA